MADLPENSSKPDEDGPPTRIAGPDAPTAILVSSTTALARVGGYLRGTTVLSAIIALTDLVFLVVLGVPLALPLAVLAFLSGYIPYFGGIITTGIMLLITLASQGPFSALVLLVLIGIRNVILGYGVRPAIYGRTVSIHPALVLIALPAGYQLGGIVGLFAAVPLTAVILAVASAVVSIVDPQPHPPLPGLVPAWLDRVARSSWRILVVIALIALLDLILTAVPLVIVPVVLSVILAATFEPVVQALMRRGHGRGRAAAIAVGGSFLGIVLVITLTMVVLVDQASQLGATAISGAGSVSAALDGQLQLSADAVAAAVGVILHAIAAVADAVVSITVISVLSALLSFYLLRDGGRLWTRITARVPGTMAPQVQAAGSRASEVLGGYMFGTAAFSLVGAASQLLIMVVGIPWRCRSSCSRSSCASSPTSGGSSPRAWRSSSRSRWVRPSTSR